MQSEWQQRLIERGAVVTAGCVAHFGAPQDELQATAAATVLCDLSHHAVLAIAGADAAEFLQGQLTNDVRQLQPGRSQLSAYCDHKGRVLALLRLWSTADGFLAALPGELAEETAKRLRLFVLRSQVTITDVGDAMVRLGLAGPEAAALLRQALGGVPEGANQVAMAGAVRLTRLPGDHPRFELHVPAHEADALWQTLAAQARPVGAGCWNLLTIRAAQPEVIAATRALFTPQMLNLEVLDGVSFNKGCYTGQEVVARTQFLGTIKRRMYPGRIAHAAAPLPGSELSGGEAAAGQATGRIVLAAPSPEGGYEVLAMAQIGAREADGLHLADTPEAVLELRDPPYSLEQIKPGSR